MTLLEQQPRTRVVFGPGVLDQLGSLAAELGFRRALLVTDRGLIAAGHFERAAKLLQSAGISVAGFHDFPPNPDTRAIEAGRDAARAAEVDSIIGLGGGSSMDCAKGINFLYTNGGDMRQYRGINKAAKPMLPLIAVPTTAGTGSEAQSFALITDPDTHEKMACGDLKALARIAILDQDQNELYCNDNAPSCPSGQSAIVDALLSEGTYYLVIDSATLTGGTYTVQVDTTHAPPGAILDHRPDIVTRTNEHFPSTSLSSPSTWESILLTQVAFRPSPPRAIHQSF